MAIDSLRNANLFRCQRLMHTLFIIIIQFLSRFDIACST
jgi:hypothetical protein